MSRNRTVIPALLLCACICTGQTPAAAQMRSLTRTEHRIEVQLERASDQGWVLIDPAKVLDARDRVRFRVRTNFDGYLYVLNRGTSGAFALLFPGKSDVNRIRNGQEYMVPASAGSFEVTGKPGFETLYWIVSPAMLTPEPDLHPSPASPPAPSRPNAPDRGIELLPRCHDEIFRARGECVDVSAGPRAAAITPRGWNVSAVRSRDLVFQRTATVATVSSTTPLTEPVIYEYRLAHR